MSTESVLALPGSIFALDRGAIVKAMDVLRHAAGNFYVNDKPAGGVDGFVDSVNHLPALFFRPAS